MKRIFPKIALVLVLFLAVGLLLTARNIYSEKSIRKDPIGQLTRSLEKTKSVMQQDFLLAASGNVEQAMKNGAMQLELTSAESGSSITGTAYLRDNAFALTDVTMLNGTQQYAFSFWLDREAIALSLPAPAEEDEDCELDGSPSTPDQNANSVIYGLNFETLASDLKGSPLLTVAGISYEEIAPLLDTVSASTQAEQSQDWNTLLATKQQVQRLLESSSFAVTDTTLEMDVGTVRVFRLTFTLTALQLCEVVDIYHNWFLNTDTYKTMLAEDATLSEELQSSVNTVKQAMIEANASILLDFYLHANNELILRADCRADWLVDSKAATVSATIDLGGDPASSLLYSVKVTSDHPETGKDMYSLEYHRSHAHNLPTRKLILKTTDATATILDLHKNELTGAFEVSLMDDAYKLSGVSTKEGGNQKIQFAVNDDISAAITLIPQTQMPEMPDFQNLCFLSQEELEELLGITGDDDYTEYPDIPQEPGDVVMEIMGLNDSGCLAQITYEEAAVYGSLGELLVAKGIAVLDKQGRIVSMHTGDLFAGMESVQIPGNNWDLYVGYTLHEGSLYDIPITAAMEILILGS